MADYIKWFIGNNLISNKQNTNEIDNCYFSDEFDDDHFEENSLIDCQNNTKNIINTINDKITINETITDNNNYNINNDTINNISNNISNDISNGISNDILSEYSKCIDDDNQITNEIMTLVKSFEGIKTKINNFENDIKEFVGTKGSTWKTSESEEKNIENKNNFIDKIKDIENKLENTIILINNINFGAEDFLTRILHLENSIKENELHRKEFINKFEKFTKEHDEIKQKQIVVNDIILKNNNFFGNICSYATCGIITFGIAFVISKFYAKK
jgi:hypothetical protein